MVSAKKKCFPPGMIRPGLKMALVLVLVGLLTPGMLKAQDLDQLRMLLEEKRLDDIAPLMPQAVIKYPNEPLILFLQAVLEPDGKKSVRLYEQFFEKNRNSAYADKALLKIAQYYFARGLYASARKHSDFLRQYYANSVHADLATYLTIQCLMAEGNIGQARQQAQIFNQQFPGSPYQSLMSPELKASASLSEPNKPVIPEKNTDAGPAAIVYTVQVGAFKSRENAMRQNDDLLKMGYGSFVKTKRRNDEIYYVVFIGKFSEKSQADKFGEEFYDKYGIPYRVVEF